MKASWKAILAWGLPAVFITWLGAMGSTLLLANRISANDATHFGALGDMFGASSALFGGLGFLGVAVVLAYDIQERRRDLEHRQQDLEDRRRSRRPYVLPSIPADGVKLQRAIWDGQHFTAAIEIELELENATEEPALNIELQSSVMSVGAPLNATVRMPGLPLGAHKETRASLHFGTDGPKAQEMVELLCAKSGLEVKLTVRYESLNDKSWLSLVSYVVRCDRAADRSQLEKVLDKTTGESITSSGGDVVGATILYLEAEAVSDSWKQKPA